MEDLLCPDGFQEAFSELELEPLKQGQVTLRSSLLVGCFLIGLKQVDGFFRLHGTSPVILERVLGVPKLWRFQAGIDMAEQLNFRIEAGQKQIA